jgi:DNA-binding MarR family transcriptional regulator
VDEVKRADYVDRWGALLESQGEPRIAGRLYAQVATAREPYLTLQQLADQLGVSRASVSTNTRRLVQTGMLTRVALPDSRELAYAVDAAGTLEMVARIALAAKALESLAEEGLQLQPDVVTPGTLGLRAMSEIFHELSASLERLASGSSRRTRSSKRAAQ